MKVTVYGSWHLAEVYAVGLCDLGHRVRLISSHKVCQNYKKGRSPVFEPGIAEGIKKHTETGRLSFSDGITDPANKAKICFFAQDVNTTSKGVNVQDIESHFRKVTRSKNSRVICISSQLPIGTSRKWQNRNKDTGIVYFPEFLRFGDALRRFLEPDYMVLGGETEDIRKVLKIFTKINSPKFSVSLEEAEMSKHAANIFVAMTVSFISELTKFSEQFNINLEKIGEVLRMDKRVGPKAYTMPGLGFSGTVERDLLVLINEAKRLKKKLPLFEQIVAVNNEHNKFIEYELKNRFKTFKRKRIGFLGATYKPLTSNMRGSLVAPIMEKLAKEGAQVALYDPLVEDNSYTVGTINDVFSSADAVVVAVAKQEYKTAPYKELVFSMKRKIIIDAANMFKKGDAKKLNVDYSSIGRGKL